jgi:hypothetical protein
MEEADARTVTHAMDMVEHKAHSLLLRASDTDVVVIALSFFSRLIPKGLKVKFTC